MKKKKLPLETVLPFSQTWLSNLKAFVEFQIESFKIGYSNDVINFEIFFDLCFWTKTLLECIISRRLFPQSIKAALGFFHTNSIRLFIEQGNNMKTIWEN